jgi:hypothetical protein
LIHSLQDGSHGRNRSLRYGRSEDDYGTGVEVAEGDVEKAAVDT